MTITVGKSQATIDVLHRSNFKRWNENLCFSFVMAKISIQTKLISHKITLPDNFFVHHELNALPIEFTQIKTAYNAVNDI